jgi:uracil phosphoribosyltransferase
MRDVEFGPNVRVLTHPLIQQKLAAARDIRTDAKAFRRTVSELAAMMAFEVVRDEPTATVDLTTPFGAATGVELAGEITLVPILRSGLAMADGVLSVIPQARVAHLGIYRDETSLEPVVYYNRLPPDIAATTVYVLDAMVATGGSAAEAISAVKRSGATSIKVLCLVAVAEGLRRVTQTHPDVPVYTAAIDPTLDRNGYIVPGLGDAGDRLYGTQ